MEDGQTDELVSRQIDWVMYWYRSWTDNQKGSLMNRLIALAIPNDVCILSNAVGTMCLQGRESLPVFLGQIKVFNKWFDAWSPEERQFFMDRLQEKDPKFVASFHKRVESRSLDLVDSVEMEYSFSVDEVKAAVP